MKRLILYLSVSALFQAIGYVMVKCITINCLAMMIIISLPFEQQGDYHIARNAQDGQDSFEGFCIFQGYWVLFFGNRKNTFSYIPELVAIG